MDIKKRKKGIQKYNYNSSRLKGTGEKKEGIHKGDGKEEEKSGRYT